MSHDIVEINKNLHQIIPHRYPMLLVDKVISVDPGNSIVALKNTTINEQFYSGHFPGYPIMPGVLIIEGLAQASGIMMQLGLEDVEDSKLFVFAGADQVRFKTPVVPGDTLYYVAEKQQFRSVFLKTTCKAFLDKEQTKLACSATITLAWTKK